MARSNMVHGRWLETLQTKLIFSPFTSRANCTPIWYRFQNYLCIQPNNQPTNPIEMSYYKMEERMKGKTVCLIPPLWMEPSERNIFQVNLLYRGVHRARSLADDLRFCLIPF